MNKTLFGSAVAITLIVLALSVTQPFKAMAGLSGWSGGGISGWGWSSTVGWLSASSTDSGAGGGPYEIRADASGNIIGYVWSSNIGWIKFGGLPSGFPVGPGNALVNISTGNVTGWARACAGTVGGDCSSMTSRSDGWDGWIELSGTNHATGDLSGNGGVTMDPSTGAFVGYAWGGPVVGWLQLTGMTLCLVTCTAPPPSPITGTCTASPTPPPPLGPNTQVIFTAIPANGTGPYIYDWGTGYVLSNTSPAINYPATGPGPNVMIKDVNNTSTSLPGIPCPTVTITQPPPPLGNSNLLIAKLGNPAVNNSVSLNRNTQFFLTFNATLTSDYSCSATPTGVSSWNPIWTAIPSSSDNFNGTYTWNGTTAALNTGTVAFGVYSFVMKCTSATNPQQSSTATLHIISTTENPI